MKTNIFKYFFVFVVFCSTSHANGGSSTPTNESELFALIDKGSDILYKEENFQKALDIFLPLAKKGDWRGEMWVGEIYGYPYHNPLLDLEKAAFWKKKAALQGVAGAEYKYGSFLRSHSPGSYSDKIKDAMPWYKKAAEQGHALAQLFLGDMILRQERPDILQAYVWQQLAYNRLTTSPDEKYRELVKNSLTSIKRTLPKSLQVKGDQLVQEWEKNHPNSKKTWPVKEWIMSPSYYNYLMKKQTDQSVGPK